MNMIYMLIGVSIILALVFLAAFFWASNTGQHDDTHTPGMRMLFDDELKADDENSDEDHI
jgi:cbb3-type cytochrome oxidase maturation protein